MKRHELTDEQWALIEDLFPPQQGNGRPWRDHRAMVNAMMWILNAGSRSLTQPRDAFIANVLLPLGSRAWRRSANSIRLQQLLHLPTQAWE